jgi:hypothetical protein
MHKPLKCWQQGILKNINESSKTAVILIGTIMSFKTGKITFSHFYTEEHKITNKTASVHQERDESNLLPPLFSNKEQEHIKRRTPHVLRQKRTINCTIWAIQNCSRQFLNINVSLQLNPSIP